MSPPSSHEPLGPDTDVLLAQAAAGDGKARDALFTRHRPRLRSMVQMRIDQRLRQRVDPSDVVQEAMTEASRRLDDFLVHRPRPFYPWLRQVTWDKLLQAHRRHIDAEKRSVRREQSYAPGLPNESFCQLAEQLVTSSINPSRRILQRELYDRVLAALKKLSADDRELLVLRHLEQLSVGEIADVLGASETAVTTRHLRAVQRIRRLLGDDLGDTMP